MTSISQLSLGEDHYFHNIINLIRRGKLLVLVMTKAYYQSHVIHSNVNHFQFFTVSEMEVGLVDTT